MPDIETLPAIAMAPAGASPETLAAADALYERAGYSKEDRAKAGFGGSAPAVPPVNSNVTVTTHPSGGTFMRNDGISHDQAVSAAKNLITHGVDPAIVAEAALSHGLKPEEFAAKPSQQEIAQQQRETATAQSFEPPAKGERYDLNYGRDFAEASDTTDLVALDKDFQQGFKAAGVPKELAQPLLNSILETGAVYADEAMTEAGKETYWREQRAIFARTSKDPAADDAYAVRGFAALPKKMQEELTANHAVHSATALLQLAALGKALEYRASKSKGK